MGSPDILVIFLRQNYQYNISLNVSEHIFHG
jgi:hypothetical protein